MQTYRPRYENQVFSAKTRYFQKDEVLNEKDIDIQK